MSPNDVIESAQKASQLGDRVLFIIAIAMLTAALVFVTRYVITRMEKMVEKGNDMANNLTGVVARNTSALDNNSNVSARTTVALDNNAAVIKDCQTELIRCREHGSHGH